MTCFYISNTGITIFTLQSEPVSSHIKEAIKRKKLHRELHPNSADFTADKPSVTSRVRNQNAQASHNNRYRVLSGKRALGLNELDEADEDKDFSEGHEGSTKDSQSLSDNKENTSVCSNSQADSSKSNKKFASSPEKENSVEARPNAPNAKEEFCIFDIEKDIEKPDPFFGVSQVCMIMD